MAACFSAAALQSNELCVVSYNLRYASPTGPNSWPERRPLIRNVIQSMAPDVVGTQEGLHAQLLDMETDLPAFSWIGEGRDGATRGEFMAVFYLKDRLQPLATNHFWLSDTPEAKASRSWGNRLPRMVTNVRFRDRFSGHEFEFFNTHWDHEVELSRRRSAELIRKHIEALSNAPLLILAGDFNANAGQSDGYSILTRGGLLKDSWTVAAARKGEGVGTFNSFRAVQPDGPRIDWILFKGDFEIPSAEIVTLKPNDQWASDHFPVMARFRFPRNSGN